MDTSVVITGGARGIGRAIAQRMVARGHRVVLTDVDGAAAADTAAELGAEEGLTHDVRNPAEHRPAAEAALDHAPLVAWFNNAGVGDDGRLSELTEEQVRRLVDVNLLGVLWGMRAAVAAFGAAAAATSSTPPRSPVSARSRATGCTPPPRPAVVSITGSVDAETPRRRALPRGVPGRRRHRDAHRGPHRTTRSARGSPTPAGRVLTAEEVARHAVSLVGSRRVVVSVPAWRGGVARAAGVAPSLSRHAMRLVEAQGRRAIARRAAR